MVLTPEQARRLDAHLFDGNEVADASPVEGPGGEQPLPASIGGYRVLRVVGSGGMGTVYEAEQASPRRLVALKLMRAGIASRTAMRRFQNEVEVLAHLSHPGIAQIYEAGTYDDGSGGVPYFAMEYVRDGRPITRYAAERKLPMRERLALFVQVCDAVHHGHQKGVIHRDLKPENILVGGGDGAAGVPAIKVIDFGVARATESDIAVTTIETDSRTLIGTLQYMSPEQCDLGTDGKSLDLDIRSDVYSLGVVLYELLTGRVPHDITNRTVHASMRLIQEGAVRSPSSFDRALRGDLETIILKAIERDREKRYDSAAALGQDVRRHLSGQPIDARPPTRWVKAVRWLTRHPALTTAVACLAIVALSVPLTYATVWWLGRRPDRIEVSEDRQEVRLRSVAGNVIRIWRGNGDIRLARMLERPAEMGGGRMIVLIGPKLDERGHLLAFDPDGDLDVPLWSVGVSESDLPDDLLGQTRSLQAFNAHAGVIADVFPDIPGDEIVVTYVDAGSRCLLRICDLAGKTLFQVWHHGHLISPCWLPEYSRLVLAGFNTEAYWHERSVTLASGTGYHPRILVAITPQLDLVTREWIKTQDNAGTFMPDWYTGMLPGEHGDVFRALSVRPPDSHDPLPARFMCYLTLRSDEGAGITCSFNELGVEVAPRSMNNIYAAALAADTAPPVEEFGFGRLPGRVKR